MRRGEATGASQSVWQPPDSILAFVDHSTGAACPGPLPVRDSGVAPHCTGRAPKGGQRPCWAGAWIRAAQPIAAPLYWQGGGGCVQPPVGCTVGFVSGQGHESVGRATAAAASMHPSSATVSGSCPSRSRLQQTRKLSCPTSRHRRTTRRLPVKTPRVHSLNAILDQHAGLCLSGTPQ